MRDDARSPSAARRRIHWPALLTIARVVLVVPVVALTLAKTKATSWVAFFAFGVAALTDGFDGFAARRMQLVSSAGQLWDPIADKILVIASMLALVIVGRFPSWAAAIIVARESAVTVLRWVADRRHRGFPASITGKMKTGAQLTAVLLYILPAHTAPGWVEGLALWTALVLTVVSGVQYFLRAPGLLADAR
jgi:CDP-diacylglycerol--glycerol-3-phosphate 3-phosphatidyltransferase